MLLNLINQLVVQKYTFYCDLLLFCVKDLQVQGVWCRLNSYFCFC